jgi:hypothetical protein
MGGLAYPVGPLISGSYPELPIVCQVLSKVTGLAKPEVCLLRALLIRRNCKSAHSTIAKQVRTAWILYFLTSNPQLHSDAHKERCHPQNRPRQQRRFRHSPRS